jgi:predicted O-methyltransferase YrrM
VDAERFEAIDDYICRHFVPPDPMLDAALRAAEEAGLPRIQISAVQGKLLYLLAKIAGARRILEIGTLGGYSTIWLGRALPPDGTLITLELDPRHAEVAGANLARAGLSDRVEIMVGPAMESLRALHAREETPFDLVFLDADKGGYAAYLQWALRLSRPGAVIAADNVVRGGDILDPDSTDASVLGVRAFNAALAAEPRLEAVILQQVGAKGYDGLALARVAGASASGTRSAPDPGSQ